MNGGKVLWLLDKVVAVNLDSLRGTGRAITPTSTPSTWMTFCSSTV
ncbi:MAG: hypothetical protein H6560_27710 [Lewinellaceae bacterium]|nr:hypothetical protein [Lewinellaceae bacterium]